MGLEENSALEYHIPNTKVNKIEKLDIPNTKVNKVEKDITNNKIEIIEASNSKAAEPPVKNVT